MLENRIYDVAQGIHYLVADRHGNSFIFEVNHLDQQAYITDNGGKPAGHDEQPGVGAAVPREVSPRSSRTSMTAFTGTRCSRIS